MENNSQAIELKGIARSLTKLGVQDGQCEDIVNLRLKDGSWRVSDGGKLVHTLPDNYTQLYVHTNVYHHLLGVLNDKLWYFANIENDGETFTPLDTPVEICDVQGDVTIVQNGHLLTIICAAASVTTPLPLATSSDNKIKYAIFKTGTNEYKEIKTSYNENQSDRDLYPFGKVHFNSISLDTEEYSISDKEWGDHLFTTPYEGIPYALEKLGEKGLFAMPILAIAAIEDYDGNYIFASNPQYIFPKEKLYYLQEENKCLVHEYELAGQNYKEKNLCTIKQSYICDLSKTEKNDSISTPFVDLDNHPEYLTALQQPAPLTNVMMNSALMFGNSEWNVIDRFIYGSKLTLSLDNYDFINDNSDVFKSLCVFITKQVNVFPTSYDDYTECDKNFDADSNSVAVIKTVLGHRCVEFVAYKNIRAKKYIINDLLKSPFYLLRRYELSEIPQLKTNPVIDLTDRVEDKYVLRPDNLIMRPTLTSNSIERYEYLPKVAYNYNQRLHLANYKKKLFHGYPIDCFQLSNHNVKIKQGSYAVGGVLPNLKDGADFQYSREKIFFIDANDQEAERYVEIGKQIGAYFAFVKVTIETQHGESEVVRYIAPYNAHVFSNGDKANFVESLSPLLTYPDSRAKEMQVRIACLKGETVEWIGGIFHLSPHQYLNIAYYITPTLKPISFHDDFIGFGSCSLNEFDDYGVTEDFITPKESNSTESYPNGLKVSKVNNPFYFPNATTYQVGSAEIVALMSNAVAVGTGQTGAAPLYVFCKDGIYALLVDSSGELAYTNARIIARDVCNNANSVTPIDSGVVFTTDRGLMSIAGSEVVELGQIAEGDVFDITDNGNLPTNPAIADKAKKIMFNSFTMSQLGALPQDLLDNKDFLTFLKGSIVNYNHNERELMVSNPNYEYTYVMDRNGNWSRRNYRADEYVNNYPTSYRVKHVSDQYGERSYLYKVDADDATTPGNSMYLLSQVIKLGTIAFKQAYRLVVRGYFESINGSSIGCYVFGSYDGRQWALLGCNEKSGKFTDIGCKIAHTDVKFLRLCLAGQLSKESRIDFVEVAADGSILNTKVR